MLASDPLLQDKVYLLRDGAAVLLGGAAQNFPNVLGEPDGGWVGHLNKPYLFGKPNRKCPSAIVVIFRLGFRHPSLPGTVEQEVGELGLVPQLGRYVEEFGFARHQIFVYPSSKALAGDNDL